MNVLSFASTSEFFLNLKPAGTFLGSGTFNSSTSKFWSPSSCCSRMSVTAADSAKNLFSSNLFMVSPNFLVARLLKFGSFKIRFAIRISSFRSQISSFSLFYNWSRTLISFWYFTWLSLNFVRHSLIYSTSSCFYEKNANWISFNSWALPSVSFAIIFKFSMMTWSFFSITCSISLIVS